MSEPVQTPTGAQPPIELKTLKQGHRVKVAAGFKALFEVAEYGLRQTGLKNTIATAHKLNQTDGFDCQSCAWPSPDKDRKVAEFCENGAKAIADELTRRRVEPSCAVFLHSSRRDDLSRPGRARAIAS